MNFRCLQPIECYVNYFKFHCYVSIIMGLVDTRQNHLPFVEITGISLLDVSLVSRGSHMTVGSKDSDV